MANVTISLAVIEGIGQVDMTYDDALAVGDDILNCDIVEFAVNIAAGRTARVLLQRGNSDTWQERTATGPLDETYPAGGQVQKVEDLTGVVFGGAE